MTVKELIEKLGTLEQDKNIDLLESESGKFEIITIINEADRVAGYTIEPELDQVMAALKMEELIMLCQLAIMGITRAQQLNPKDYNNLLTIEMKIRRNLLKYEKVFEEAKLEVLD